LLLARVLNFAILGKPSISFIEGFYSSKKTDEYNWLLKTSDIFAKKVEEFEQDTL
jgi:hypothetical protein